jgi:hypothetical protein
VPPLDTLSNRFPRLTALLKHRVFQRTVRLLFIAGVLGWLVYQLSDIGWGEVWASRPRTPWFYLIWVVMYFQLPFVEGVVYRTLWRAPFRLLLPPIFRKRALNQDVMNYSGEAYFFVWARRNLGLSKSYLAGTLKDVAIVSSLASWTGAVLLVSVFLLAGEIVLTDLLGEPGPWVTGGVVLLVVGLVGLGVYFRNTLFTLATRDVVKVYAVYLVRFIVFGYVLQMLQWWVVLPSAPLSVWATMLATMTIINRLPLIPAKDLVGIGAILGISGLLAASEATILAMLLTRSALDKSTNLVLFLGTTLIEKRRGTPALPIEDEGDADDEMPVASVQEAGA